MSSDKLHGRAARMKQIKKCGQSMQEVPARTSPAVQGDAVTPRAHRAGHWVACRVLAACRGEVGSVLGQLDVGCRACQRICRRRRCRLDQQVAAARISRRCQRMTSAPCHARRGTNGQKRKQLHGNLVSTQCQQHADNKILYSHDQSLIDSTE